MLTEPVAGGHRASWALVRERTSWPSGCKPVSSVCTHGVKWPQVGAVLLSYTLQAWVFCSSLCVTFFLNLRLLPFTYETEAKRLSVACGALPKPACPAPHGPSAEHQPIPVWVLPSRWCSGCCLPRTPCPLSSCSPAPPWTGTVLFLTCTHCDPLWVAFLRGLTITLFLIIPCLFPNCPAGPTQENTLSIHLPLSTVLFNTNGSGEEGLGTLSKKSVHSNSDCSSCYFY